MSDSIGLYHAFIHIVVPTISGKKACKRTTFVPKLHGVVQYFTTAMPRGFVLGFF